MPDLEIQRRLDASVDRVFQAWSDPKQMERWFFAGHKSCKATNDFRVGGGYRVEMIGSESGANHVHSGTYKTIEPNRKIAFTWSSHIVEDTLVTLTFAEDGQGTVMTLHHELLPDAEAHRLHNMGWNACLDNLDALVAQGTPASS